MHKGTDVDQPTEPGEIGDGGMSTANSRRASSAAGVFGAHHAHKYQADDRVELVGVYDLDPERTEALAETLGVRAFDNMDDMLDLLDIVTIACPPVTHASAAAAALEYGKHVLIEKPITTSVSEAELLIMVADLQKLVLACGHQERLVFEAMGLFAAAEKPTRIESVREGPWTGRSADVSVTLDLMVHDLDLALTLMGEAPESIKAQGARQARRCPPTGWTRADFRAARRRISIASRVAEARMRTMRIVYPSGEVKIDFLARTFENSTKVALNADFAQTARRPRSAGRQRFTLHRRRARRSAATGRHWRGSRRRAKTRRLTPTKRRACRPFGLAEASNDPVHRPASAARAHRRQDRRGAGARAGARAIYSRPGSARPSNSSSPRSAGPSIASPTPTAPTRWRCR